jgi:hypothetical protein
MNNENICNKTKKVQKNKMDSEDKMISIDHKN